MIDAYNAMTKLIEINYLIYLAVFSLANPSYLISKMINS